jgi:hypothetical protein
MVKVRLQHQGEQCFEMGSTGLFEGAEEMSVSIYYSPVTVEKEQLRGKSSFKEKLESAFSSSMPFELGTEDVPTLQACMEFSSGEDKTDIFELIEAIEMYIRIRVYAEY